jgi:heptosyltransferase-1
MQDTKGEVRNILIVKLSAIGDVVHALPAAYSLKKCFPEAHITWVVEKPSFDLVNNNPYIDEIIVFDKPKFKSLSGLLRNAPGFIRKLKEKHFDISLDLQALFKSGIIAYLSGAKNRLVYCNTREGADLLSKRTCGPNQKGHVVQRYLDVVRALGCSVDEVVFPIAITDEEKMTASAIVRKAGLDIDKPYVILSPGANWPNKRWSPKLFAALADKLYDDVIIPVVTGGPGDRIFAEEIMATAEIPPVDLTGKTSLKQLAYIITKAQAFVGGDTGPMHLAAALGTPVVAIHGPTDTIRNGPFGSGHKTLVAGHECAGCWKRKCPKDIDCLSVISVDDVYHAVQGVRNED